MASLKAGRRLRSAVCSTEVMVIAAPEADVELRCGGAPMIEHESQPEPGATLDPDAKVTFLRIHLPVAVAVLILQLLHFCDRRFDRVAGLGLAKGIVEQVPRGDLALRRRLVRLVVLEFLPEFLGVCPPGVRNQPPIPSLVPAPRSQRRRAPG